MCVRNSSTLFVQQAGMAQGAAISAFGLGSTMAWPCLAAFRWPTMPLLNPSPTTMP